MWKKVLQWSLAITILIFLFFTLKNSWDDLQAYDFSLAIVPLIISIPFAIVHFILIAIAWGKIVNILHPSGLKKLQAIKIRTVSDFARFLPGKIWFIIGRIKLTNPYNIPAEKIIWSTLFEDLLNLCAAFITFLFVLLGNKDSALFTYGLWFLPALAIIFFIIHPKILQKIMNISAKILKREPVVLHASYQTMLTTFLLFVSAWVILGIGFVFLTSAISPISFASAPALLGIFGFSWGVGLLIFVLPSGLGAREAVQSYLLSFLFPVPVAIVISIVSRIWLLGAEILTALPFLKKGKVLSPTIK